MSSVNRWDCQHPGCGNSAIGSGSAFGLRAIGWYFRSGPNGGLFCPGHRPDPIPCTEAENKGKPCRYCAAEAAARAIQAAARAGATSTSEDIAAKIDRLVAIAGAASVAICEVGTALGMIRSALSSGGDTISHAEANGIARGMLVDLIAQLDAAAPPAPPRRGLLQ